jgi:hypothetical protein
MNGKMRLILDICSGRQSSLLLTKLGHMLYGIDCRKVSWVLYLVSVESFWHSRILETLSTPNQGIEFLIHQISQMFHTISDVMNSYPSCPTCLITSNLIWHQFTF